MHRALLHLLIFWAASLLASALEMNAARDFALIESGLYGVDDFTDPNLAKWTIDAGTLGADIVHSAANGGMVTLTGIGKYMRYTASPVSPTLLLPASTIQMAVLESWYLESATDERDAVLLGSGGPVAGPLDYGTAPFDAPGWGFSTINKVWFATGWTGIYWVPGSTTINQWNPFGLVDGNPNDLEWLGTRIEPDGVGFSRDCSAAGTDNFQSSLGHSNGDWADRHCIAANYESEGWPGLITLSAGDGSLDRCEIFEAHIWKHDRVTVIGVPNNHYVQVEMVAGTPTSHPTYTLPARILSSGKSQDIGTPDECGFTIEFSIYDAVTSPPRFQTVRVREFGTDDILTEISPTEFQSGAYGGDVYTLCVSGLTSPCPPLSDTTHFFFGGRISPTTLLTKTASLDAILVEPAPPAPGGGYGTDAYGTKGYGT